MNQNRKTKGVAFATAVAMGLIIASFNLACMESTPLLLGGGTDAGPAPATDCLGKAHNSSCREAGRGPCDAVELCSCGGSGTVCDEAHRDCPADQVEASGTICANAQNVEGTCNGSSAQCQVPGPDAGTGECTVNSDCASGRCVNGTCMPTFVVIEVSITDGQGAEAHVYGAADPATDNTIDHADATTYTIGLTQKEACTGPGIEIAVRVARAIIEAMPWYSCNAPGRTHAAFTRVKINGVVVTGSAIAHAWVCDGVTASNLAFSREQLGCPSSKRGDEKSDDDFFNRLRRRNDDPNEDVYDPAAE